MDNKIIVTFDIKKPIDKPILNEYDNLVKLSYGNVPMNVTSIIGHHVTKPIPNNCTYTKK
jgi:hypothetical protein